MRARPTNMQPSPVDSGMMPQVGMQSGYTMYPMAEVVRPFTAHQRRLSFYLGIKLHLVRYLPLIVFLLFKGSQKAYWQRLLILQKRTLCVPSTSVPSAAAPNHVHASPQS